MYICIFYVLAGLNYKRINIECYNSFENNFSSYEE